VAVLRPSAAADEVRRLARAGLLADHFRKAPRELRRWLRAGAGEIAGPLVFMRVTRPVERKRGHHRCAAGLHQLAPDCLDRYHDDLDAVLDDLFTHANVPVANLEGWLTARLVRATVDGHRRRRGERGAPQRPRVPIWLADLLEHDAWLLELAKAILEWAGTDATAGASLWPVSTWVERRAAVTGDHAAGEAAVTAEIERVLTAMRRRPTWYEKTVERGLGRKQAPVWFPARTGGAHAEPEPLVVARHELDDALLTQLAALAIEVMTARIGRGENPAVVAEQVLRTVFGAVPASYDLDRAPSSGITGPEQVTALIGDPERFDRVLAEVISLLPSGDNRRH
jgi:hypothetical protein